MRRSFTILAIIILFSTTIYALIGDSTTTIPVRIETPIVPGNSTITVQCSSDMSLEITVVKGGNGTRITIELGQEGEGLDPIILSCLSYAYPQIIKTGPGAHTTVIMPAKTTTKLTCFTTYYTYAARAGPETSSPPVQAETPSPGEAMVTGISGSDRILIITMSALLAGALLYIAGARLL